MASGNASRHPAEWVLPQQVTPRHVSPRIHSTNPPALCVEPMAVEAITPDATAAPLRANSRPALSCICLGRPAPPANRGTVTSAAAAPFGGHRDGNTELRSVALALSTTSSNRAETTTRTLQAPPWPTPASPVVASASTVVIVAHARDDLGKVGGGVRGDARLVVEIVHSTSQAPAGWRACVAGGAEEPRLARRVRSSKRRRHDACAVPRRRRARAIRAAVPSHARAAVPDRPNAALPELVRSRRRPAATARFCSGRLVSSDLASTTLWQVLAFAA